MRFPRAAATETAKTRLFELSPSWSTAPQRSAQLRADLTLEDRRS